MTSMRNRLLLGLALGFGFGQSAAFAAAAPTASINGVVINSDSAAPVMGVVVQAYDDTNWQIQGATVTDAAGGFTIGGLREGWFMLQLSRDFYFAASTLGIRVADGSHVELAKVIRLMPVGSKQGNMFERHVPMHVFSGPMSQLGWSITGSVVQSGNHSPVSGAVVAAYIAPYGDAQSFAVTDSNGQFAIAGLAPGMYTLRTTLRSSVPTVVEGVSVARGTTSLSKPIEIAGRIIVLDDRGMFRPCGDLVQPGRTADVYIVCGDRLNY